MGNDVSMLSSVQKSEKAINLNIWILRVSTTKRNFLIHNASILQRMERIELKQLKIDEKFDAILDKLNFLKTKEVTSFSLNHLFWME